MVSWSSNGRLVLAERQVQHPAMAIGGSKGTREHPACLLSTLAGLPMAVVSPAWLSCQCWEWHRLLPDLQKEISPSGHPAVACGCHLRAWHSCLNSIPFWYREQFWDYKSNFPCCLGNRMHWLCFTNQANQPTCKWPSSWLTVGAKTRFSSEAVEVLPFPNVFGSPGWQDCQAGVDSRSFSAGSFSALLHCAAKSVQKSRLGAGGLPWKELPHRTEFIVGCLVVVSFWERNFHNHYKTGRWTKLTQAGHKIGGSWNNIIKDFFYCFFFFLPLEGVHMCSGKQILVSRRILMAVSLEPVLQHSRERRKEEGLLEWMGASVSPGPAAPDLVLAFQKQEEKKTWRRKRGDLDKYPSVRKYFKEQFSSFSQVLLKHHCYSLFIWTCYEVARGESRHQGDKEADACDDSSPHGE